MQAIFVNNGPVAVQYTIFGWAENVTRDARIDLFVQFVVLPAPPPPNEPPIASASADKTEVSVGEEVSFSSSGSWDPDGYIAACDWDFGDGWTSASPNPTHAYDEPGTYEVTLVVTDDDGLQSEPAHLTVTVTVPNQPPTAVVSTDALAKAVGEEFAFDGSSSTDPDGEIVSGSWSFGDGGTSTEVSPKHVYNEPGTYTVTLTVTDDDGATGQATRSVRVEPSLVIYSVAAEEQKILVGGFDHENYKTKVYAIVEPPVVGAKVEFAFAGDSGKGVDVDPALSPASALTDATGRAETTLTSGDLVTVIKVMATRGASSLQATVQIVGVTGAIYSGEQDITGPPGGKTQNSGILIPIGGQREFEGKEFTSPVPLRLVAVEHWVVADLKPKGTDVAEITSAKRFLVQADARLDHALLVKGMKAGTFEIELTIERSKSRKGEKNEVIPDTVKSQVIEVATTGVVIVTSPKGTWPDNSKLLATGTHSLTAMGLPANKNWAYEWSFARDGNLNFSSNGTYKAATTYFTAPKAPTLIGDWNKDKMKVLYYPADKKEDWVKDERALNITAPTFFDADKSEGIISTETTKSF